MSVISKKDLAVFVVNDKFELSSVHTFPCQLAGEVAPRARALYFF